MIQIPDLLPVPTQVDIVESNAEDIIDDLYKSDWQKAAKIIYIQLKMQIKCNKKSCCK